MDKSILLKAIQTYVDTKQISDRLINRTRENSYTCEDALDNKDEYALEKSILQQIQSIENTKGHSKAKKDYGDLLEKLINNLFTRISHVVALNVTNRETILGQIDVILIPTEDMLFDLLGMVGEYPKSVIGECKNYTSKKVQKYEIEKTCWRTCKGRSLSFFIAKEYTQDSIKEIQEFNRCKESYFSKNVDGVYIVPITLDMLDVVVNHNINFCYFLNWVISLTRCGSISNYL